MKLHLPGGNLLPPEAAIYLSWNDPKHPRPTIRGEIKKDVSEIKTIPSGTWQLFVESNQHFYPILSTTVEGKEREGNLIQVEDHPIEIDVNVRAVYTRMDGFASLDGKGKAGAMILLVPENPAEHSDLFRRDQSDSDGSFSFREVAPGNYRVIAIEDGWKLEWRRQDILIPYLENGIITSAPESSSAVIPVTEIVLIQPSR